MKLPQIRNMASGEVELLIYDVIGEDFFGEGISAKGVQNVLRDAGIVNTIHVRLNTPGGSAFDGLAIYNALVQHPAKVTTYVDGLAASAGSVIAMAGDEIHIAENGMMMIHQAAALAIGNAGDMLAMAELLEKMDGQIAGTYAARTGKPQDEFAEMMAAETWFTGQEAVDAGLATHLMESKRVTAAFDPKVLNRYKHQPKQLAAMFVPKPERRHSVDSIAARMKELA